MVKKVTRISTIIFIIILFLCFFIGILNIAFYFQYFKVDGFSADSNINKVYNFIFWGFSAAPLWISHWFSNINVVSATNFYLLSYLFVGIIYLLLFVYILYCYRKFKGLFYLVFLSVLIFFFLPFGFLIGTLLFINSIIYIFFKSELIKIQKQQNA